MFDSRKLARAIVADLHDREISPTVTAEIVRCVAIVHAGDDPLPTLVAKLLHRHRKRAGRRVDIGRKKRIAEAAHVARFNRSNGKEKAAQQAADKFGVRFNEVFEAAFLYRRKDMRHLMRRTKPTHQELNVGSQNENSVVDENHLQPE